jgi:hypothetical protein
VGALLRCPGDTQCLLPQLVPHTNSSAELAVDPAELAVDPAELVVDPAEVAVTLASLAALGHCTEATTGGSAADEGQKKLFKPSDF